MSTTKQPAHKREVVADAHPALEAALNAGATQKRAPVLDVQPHEDSEEQAALRELLESVDAVGAASPRQQAARDVAKEIVDALDRPYGLAQKHLREGQRAARAEEIARESKATHEKRVREAADEAEKAAHPLVTLAVDEGGELRDTTPSAPAATHETASTSRSKR